jgi:thiamine biosynthesis lipoprotein
MIAINKSRRRLLKIVGVAAVGAIVGKSFVTFKDKTELKKVTWNGIALGSQAEITIYHPSEKEAHKILTKSVGELTGLENLFSLYKDSSQLSLLNKKGYLENPHPEMVNIFNLSKKYSEMTNGAFDVTVQPLWNIYNKSFTDLGKPPSNTQISNALKLVDWKSIKVEKTKISYAIEGMSSTLNGIAQGYITDKIAESLINSGISNTLVQLGEYRGIGDHPEGRPWRLLISNPEHTNSIGEVEFTDAAVATSAGLGTPFDLSGKYHHIFNPESGYNDNEYLQVSVISKTAAEADALATAFLIMNPKKSEALAKNLKVGFEVLNNQRKRIIITKA